MLAVVWQPHLQRHPTLDGLRHHTMRRTGRCPFKQKVACTFKLAARSLAAQVDGRIPPEYTSSPVAAPYQQLA